MTTSVNTNINAMAAIQSLNNISSQMTATQSAIESGLAINSASDNPAVFTIAQGLRANINALKAVGANLTTATATVQAQTEGATSISNALTTLLQTVTQGQGESGAALAATNTTIQNALSNIDMFAEASTINGTNLLVKAGSFNVVSNVDGSTTGVATLTASTADGLGLAGLAVQVSAQTTSSANTLTLAAIAVASDAVAYTGADGSVTTFTYGDAAAVTADTTGHTILIDATGSSLATAINSVAGSNVATASAGGVVSITGGGSAAATAGVTANYTAGTTNVTAGDTFTFTSNAGVAKTFVFGTSLSTAQVSAGDVLVARGSTADASLSNLSTAMSNAGLVASIDAKGNLMTAGGTLTAGSTNAANGPTIGTAALSGTAAIDMVNAAIAQIGATLSQLGATTIQLKGLTDFTTQLSDSVTTGLGAMVDANLSAESAQLASLQTKQSLAIQSLSLANQGPASLLTLFR